MRTPSIGAVKKSKVASKQWSPPGLDPMDIYRMESYAKRVMKAYTSAGWDKEDAKDSVIRMLERRL